tara:strand:+ start:933 stop:1529 length:597 start_codon:yes stop_codon:yes gene_type:complete
MNIKNSYFQIHSEKYIKNLTNCFNEEIIKNIEDLANELLKVWTEGRKVFICGNGGSAANSIHLANDLIFGTGSCGPGKAIDGLRVEALPSNQGVITCIANDIGYENIYSKQISTKGVAGDLLIVLSGSGNSKNIINALNEAKKIKILSFAILGFDGGLSKTLADRSIHFEVNDMQISEDTQLIVGHLCMQWLTANKPH